jgi:hypothetical protein
MSELNAVVLRRGKCAVAHMPEEVCIADGAVIPTSSIHDADTT